ncbi:MAG: hypothetical protein CR988_05835 [Treponema sp.]|nr:MAG: hypothetical protein CR988_05835 [Treponema sp.]
MEVLVEWDYTVDACKEKIYKKYGDNITITRQKAIKTDGFFGFLKKDAVEITFIVDTKKEFHENTSFSKNNIKNEKSGVYIPTDIIKEKEKILQIVAEKSPEIAKKAVPDITNLQEKEAELQTDEMEMLRVTIAELAERVGKIGVTSSTFEVHPNLKKLSVILEANAFSITYIDKVVSSVKDSLSITKLDEFTNVEVAAMERIAESINLKKYQYDSFLNNEKEAKVFTIVGPTGVGKTTTLAKLMAYYLLPVSQEIQKPLKVQAVTIDKYRIGGEQQIYTYCYYMDIPLTVVGSDVELKSYLAENKNSCDVIFIDTTGRSPNDSEKIEEMYKCFTGIEADIEFFLAISASTQACDVLQIMKQYKRFNYSSIIITKFDETTYPGGIVSVIDDENTAISYITTGQTVPSDFEKATIGTFLTKLKGFDEANSFVAKNYFSEDNYITWS